MAAAPTGRPDGTSVAGEVAGATGYSVGTGADGAADTGRGGGKARASAGAAVGEATAAGRTGAGAVFRRAGSAPGAEGASEDGVRRPPRGRGAWKGGMTRPGAQQMRARRGSVCATIEAVSTCWPGQIHKVW